MLAKGGRMLVLMEGFEESFEHSREKLQQHLSLYQRMPWKLDNWLFWSFLKGWPWLKRNFINISRVISSLAPEHLESAILS